MRANKLVLSKLVLGLAAALLAISIVGCAKNAQPLTSTDTAATLGEPTTTTAETSPAKTEAEETTKYSEETQAACKRQEKSRPVLEKNQTTCA